MLENRQNKGEIIYVIGEVWHKIWTLLEILESETGQCFCPDEMILTEETTHPKTWGRGLKKGSSSSVLDH